MLDVPVSQARIQRFYSDAAPVYDDFTDEHEAAAKARAIALLARRQGERYLEVATGTGKTFAQVIAESGAEGVVGVDMAPGMIAVARTRLREQGCDATPLQLGDARALPFGDERFDCLFNSYMLDLIPTDEIPQVVAEFWRVLRPGGRLVLVNLTEGEGDDEAFSSDWKARYEREPEALGACRPVLATAMVEAQGFVGVERQYSGHGESWPSEIVVARRPGGGNEGVS